MLQVYHRAGQEAGRCFIVVDIWWDLDGCGRSEPLPTNQLDGLKWPRPHPSLCPLPLCRCCCACIDAAYAVPFVPHSGDQGPLRQAATYVATYATGPARSGSQQSPLYLKSCHPHPCDPLASCHPSDGLALDLLVSGAAANDTLLGWGDFFQCHGNQLYIMSV